MKITDAKAVFPNYKHVVPSWRTNFWQIVVRVESDSGVVESGYGGGGTNQSGVPGPRTHHPHALLPLLWQP